MGSVNEPWAVSCDELVRGAIAGIVISPVFLILRFWARWVTKSGRKSRFWWDDWLALACLPLTLAQCIIGLVWPNLGLGRHIWDLSVDEVLISLRLFYANFFITIVGSTLPKLSLLCFYARIFRSNQQFRSSLWVTGGLSVLWGAASFLSALFQCQPMAKGWNSFIPGRCIDYWVWLICIQIVSSVLDFLIACLPIAFVYKLHLSTPRKFLIGLVFVCGHAMAVFPIGRTIVLAQMGHGFVYDITVTIVPLARWVVMQIPISVCSLCIPVLPPLFIRAHRYGFRSLFSSKVRAAIPEVQFREPERASMLRTDMEAAHPDSYHFGGSFGHPTRENYGYKPSGYFATAVRSSVSENSKLSEGMSLQGRNDRGIQVIHRVETTFDASDDESDS